MHVGVRGVIFRTKTDWRFISFDWLQWLSVLGLYSVLATTTISKCCSFKFLNFFFAYFWILFFSSVIIWYLIFFEFSTRLNYGIVKTKEHLEWERTCTFGRLSNFTVLLLFMNECLFLMSDLLDNSEQAALSERFLRLILSIRFLYNEVKYLKNR